MKLLEEALNYARQGIPVFPVHGINDSGNCTCNKPDCSHPGKHPMFSGGHNNATKDEQQIKTWWNKYPQANIGVPTGEASGFYVVDIDKKNNGIQNYKAFSDRHSNMAEPGLKANTGGGGHHLIYGKPVNGQQVRSGTRIGGLDGVDFRGDGGYIVVAPSKHHSQKQYEWDAEYPFDDNFDLAKLPPLPQPVIDLIQSPPNKSPHQKIIHPGERNDYLFKQACQLRRNGITDDTLFDRVWEENVSNCSPPLDETEVRQIVDSAIKQKITPETTEHKSGKPKTSGEEAGGNDTFNKLLALTSSHELWVDKFRKAYVTYPVKNRMNNEMHYENWPIQSKTYRDYLKYLYRQHYKKPISNGILSNVLECLASDALFSGKCYEIHIRTARHDDRIIIDMTDEDWRWIEITASGWRICVDKSTVKFVRSPNARPMLTPDPTGSFECLPEVFHLKCQDDYKLLAGWLVFALVPAGPYPVLIIEGTAGSSKSTLTKQIRQVLDPKVPALQGMPPNTDDLFIQATNGHLIAFDNLSTISQQLSNVLCGIATGTGASKRELYTDTGEVYFEVCRPLILNSINPVVSAPDLADRSVRLSLPPIKERRSAEEVDALFQQCAPRILGAICNAIQAALPRYKQVRRIPSEIRMTDFAQWGFAAEDKLGPDNDFIQILSANRQHNAAPFMEDNMLNMALLKFMQERKQWSGAPTDLLNALKSKATPEEMYDKSFPKTASHLTRNLNTAITTLKQFGIEYDHESSSHKNRKVTLTYNPKDYTVNDAKLPVSWGYQSDEHPNTDTNIAEDSDESSDTDKTPDQSYRVIDNLEDAVPILEKYAESGQVMGLDIETTGLNPRRDKICLIQISDGLDTVIIDVRKHDDLSVLKEPLERIHAVAHNAVFDMSFLQIHGISLTLECTQSAHHVLTGDCKSLKDLAKDYLDITLDKSQQTSDWGGSLSDQQLQYAAQDAEVVLKLYNSLRNKLEDCDVMSAYERVRNAQPFVVAMQLNGINIDQVSYQAMLDDLKFQHGQLMQQWEAQVPGTNINSSQQLSDWIASQLSEPDSEWPNTDSGQYSTSTRDIQLNKPKLNDTAIPIVDNLLLPLKRINKEVSAFGDTFLDHIDHATGKIHPSYNLSGTVTGRLSCSKPNLQQIPRDERYRKMFHAPEGNKFVIADYSQMELRIAAMIAEEEVLLNAYRQGLDTHRLTAALILDKRTEEISKDERQLAKAINFGLLYGQGAEGLRAYASSSYGVDISIDEARAYREAWFKNYPAIARWHSHAFEIARDSMMVGTPGGRKRYFENDDYNHPKGLRKTKVFNTPIQGGAAEALLEAMTLLHTAIELQGCADMIKPIAVIHDEIILLVTDNSTEFAKQLMEKAMIDGMLAIFPRASTRDLVEAHIGDSWAEK